MTSEISKVPHMHKWLQDCFLLCVVWAVAAPRGGAVGVGGYTGPEAKWWQCGAVPAHPPIILDGQLAYVCVCICIYIYLAISIYMYLYISSLVTSRILVGSNGLPMDMGGL